MHAIARLWLISFLVYLASLYRDGPPIPVAELVYPARYWRLGFSDY